MEEEKSLKKIKNDDKKQEKIQKFKRTWLTNRLNTLLLIVIFVAIDVLINFGVKKWDPTPIDVTTSKDYSLTEESKERIKKVEKNVNIYFVGYDENSLDYKLAKQYNKSNSKINVEIIDATANPEIAKKYSVTNESPTIIVESENNSRTLSAYDLVSYDSSYKEVSIAEQKITSAILNVTTDKTPKIYFLTGYTNFSFESNGLLSVLKQFLEDEVLSYENLNILSTQKVPEDCDSLIIMTPEKDFDDIVADEIIKYIQKGGNILWFNGIYEEEKDFKNVNRVLAEYGVNKFEKGIVYETNPSNIMLEYPTCFTPTIENSEILKNVKISTGAILLNATKININEEKLEELKVTKNNLITAPETTYFTKNLTSKFDQSQDTKGSFVLGAELEKTITEADEENGKEAITSTLIIYADDYFISDYPVTNGQYTFPLISLANNKDVALNSLAKLNNNDQEITIRKSYSDSQTTFTPSERAKTIIMIIIFVVPVLVIVAGIIVWVIRKRRN